MNLILNPQYCRSEKKIETKKHIYNVFEKDSWKALWKRNSRVLFPNDFFKRKQGVQKLSSSSNGPNEIIQSKRTRKDRKEYKQWFSKLGENPKNSEWGIFTFLFQFPPRKTWGRMSLKGNGIFWWRVICSVSSLNSEVCVILINKISPNKNGRVSISVFETSFSSPKRMENYLCRNE